MKKLLVANRGEIAVRIAATAADQGVRIVAVHPTDDDGAPHLAVADEVRGLPGEGPAAYLDIDAVLAAATGTGCDAVHPGYGFLAENGDFATAVEAAGLTFVGPTPETLALFGDKSAARAHAVARGVPVARGTDSATTAAEAQDFLASLGEHGAVMVKAIAGGGGRGMRPAHNVVQLDEAMERCASEAAAAFGNADVYVEELLADARHLEVQMVGDGRGAVVSLGIRDCSVQRSRQKLLELAPAPGLHPDVARRLVDAATAVTASVGLRSLATVEFLVVDSDHADGRIVFCETNARIQVEHTVTEAVYGVDLVAAQLAIAGGATLDDLALPTEARGWAVQARINTERIEADGSVRPAGGVITNLQLPSGPGIRVDHAAVAGRATNPRYDSLLAKVVVWADGVGPAPALRRLQRALGGFVLEGVPSTAGLLQAVAACPEVGDGATSTIWLEANLDELLATATALAPAAPTSDAPADETEVRAPLQGTVLSFDVAVGDAVAVGQRVALMEAMKMEHVLTATCSGVVTAIVAEPATAVFEGHLLVRIEPGEVQHTGAAEAVEIDPDHIRPDLAEAIERHEIGRDHRRPAAVDKRRRTGQRTARENVADLVDPGSLIEYGPLVIAPQRRRRTVEDLIENTPADGMIGGIARVNGDRFGEDRSRCVVVSYDYTVLAGTQGGQNHRKKDRLFELAQQWKLPVVFFTEGGGGRPGDTDGVNVAGLDCLAFGLWGELSGLVPLVGINSGYCFAGNAAILGCCDVVIATENSNIGMGGPAMIEGGGLGVFAPTDIGPIETQRANGVVDLVVPDEAAAVAAAKQYLSYFQGPLDTWEHADQRRLRQVVPENRLRIYDVRDAIGLLFDTGSVLELRRDFGLGMVTALARIDGRAVGVIANNPSHLAGAIDADAADKAARFMQLCDAFDLPIVQLCDTPGIMVGPEAERAALVRHACRMFVTGRSVTVPTCTVVLRKGYGLGAQAMASGGFKFPMFTVAWPTGEFGGMGLEGAVRLGYRKELEAIDDPAERQAAYEERVARMYEVGKATSMADHFEIDDVIDPADTRHWITTAFAAAPPPPPREGKKRPMVDTW